jgi:hypothetical protein
MNFNNAKCKRGNLIYFKRKDCVFIDNINKKNINNTFKYIDFFFYPKEDNQYSLERTQPKGNPILKLRGIDWNKYWFEIVK